MPTPIQTLVDALNALDKAERKLDGRVEAEVAAGGDALEDRLLAIQRERLDLQNRRGVFERALEVAVEQAQPPRLSQVEQSIIRCREFLVEQRADEAYYLALLAERPGLADATEMLKQTRINIWNHEQLLRDRLAEHARDQQGAAA